MTDDQLQTRTNDKIERLYARGSEMATNATTDEERQKGLAIFIAGLDVAIQATQNAYQYAIKNSKHQ